MHYKEALTSRAYRFTLLAHAGLFRRMSDRAFLERRYRLALGKTPDLSKPETFTEKLQWLKLYYAKHPNPDFTRMADKIAAKAYVAERVGAEYIIPTYGVWESFDEIDFDALPERFVLKTNHDSGGTVVCRDKRTFNRRRARRLLTRRLRSNYYWTGRETQYRDIPPRILAEQYLEDEPGSFGLRDYKFFCFDGAVRALYITTRGEHDVRTDYFDAEFRHLPCVTRSLNADVTPAKPDNFEEMKRLASELSRGIPHVRVDLYNVGGRVYFGELTFCYLSGFCRFRPAEWDGIFGSWITLPGEARDIE